MVSDAATPEKQATETERKSGLGGLEGNKEEVREIR